MTIEEEKTMKHFRKACIVALAIVFALAAVSFAQYQYKVNKAHCGGDLAPVQAHEMLVKDKEHTFLVDVRSQPEYELIGHPEGAYNIPIKFWSNKVGEKGYEMVPNPNFGQDLLARFNPKTDTLIFMCRSGSRSCDACEQAAKAGFDVGKVHNIMGGFEGDKMKYKNSAFHGQRTGGGWRNEGLPWSYHMDKNLMYQPDLAK
jgi:rhodanese-related sulfurtransferase